MKFIDKSTIKLETEPNELDKLVIKFIRILEKHAEYVIISGYVSILLGRSRATEDVDLFIKPINKDKFKELYKDLKKNKFWCLNAESEETIYEYLEDGEGIRFAIIETAIPNFEVKFAKDSLSLASFHDPIKVLTNGDSLKISSLERQIAFKRYILKSDKDLEDAEYLEKTFGKDIDLNRIKEYKKMLQ